MSYIKKLGLNQERIDDITNMILDNNDGMLATLDAVTILLTEETISSVEAAVVLVNIGYIFGQEEQVEEIFRQPQYCN